MKTPWFRGSLYYPENEICVSKITNITSLNKINIFNERGIPQVKYFTGIYIWNSPILEHLCSLYELWDDKLFDTTASLKCQINKFLCTQKVLC